MKQQNGKTKKTLLSAIIVLIVCVAMLIGATFAWFTDSVSNNGNRIQAGTLKVDLLQAQTYDGTYESIAGQTGSIFSVGTTANASNVTLWEPGTTHVAYLAVQNKGNLALKYNIYLDITDNGLASALEYAIVPFGKSKPTAAIASWEAAKSATGATTGQVIGGRQLAAPNAFLNENGEADYFAIVVHMKEDAGNEYQEKDIVIDVNVVATQQTYEKDGFNSDQYDANATYPTLAPFINETVTSTGNFVKVTGTGANYAKTGSAEITVTQDNSPATSKVPANTDLFKGNDGTSDPIPTQNTAENFNSNLSRVITTKNATDNSVTYDLSYIYTETVEGKTYQYDVTGFSNVIENVVDIAKGLKSVTVTHSHNGSVTPMTPASDKTSKTDGSYYYDSVEGKLYIWSKLYSDFTIAYEYDFVASIGTQGYLTFGEALADANENDTVLLLKNVTESVSINKKIRVEGGGHTIMSANGNAVVINASGVVLNNLCAESANDVALDVLANKENIVIAGGNYKTATTSNIGKQGEGAIRFEGNNGNISVTGASLLGGLHVLNYASGTLTLTGNTFAVDASLTENTGIVCGILIYGSGASNQASNGPAYLSENTFSKSGANYKVLIQGADWTTYYSDKAVTVTLGSTGATKGFATLEEAFSYNAENHGTENAKNTITLNQDFDYHEKYTKSFSLMVDLTNTVFDLNQQTFIVYGVSAICFYGHDFKICNGTVNDSRTSNDIGYAIRVGNYGAGDPSPTDPYAAANVEIDNITMRGGINCCNARTVAISNVTSTANNTSRYCVCAQDCENVIIKSGTYTQECLNGYGTIADWYSYSIKIEGGTFIKAGPRTRDPHKGKYPCIVHFDGDIFTDGEDISGYVDATKYNVSKTTSNNYLTLTVTAKEN